MADSPRPTSQSGGAVVAPQPPPSFVLQHFGAAPDAPIINLTPHRVDFDAGDSLTSRQFESYGSLRAVVESWVESPPRRPWQVGALPCVPRPIYGSTTVDWRADFEAAQHVPLKVPIVIVSTIAADVLETLDALPENWPATWPRFAHVVVPDTGQTATRDAQGRVVSVKQFIYYGIYHSYGALPPTQASIALQTE